MITSRQREAAGLLAAMLGTIAATAVSLAPWRGTLAIPYSYQDDALAILMATKNLATEGWYQHSAHLNAPFGQSLYAYPSAVGDTVHFLAIKAISMFTSEPAAIVNIYFLLGFLLAGLAAYAGFRMVGISVQVAAVLAPLYAVLPYHVLQGEIHLFLSAYYGVPLAVALVIRQQGNRPIATLGGGRRGRQRLINRGNIAAVSIVLLISASGLYYAVFSMVLLAFAGAVRAWRIRRPEPLAVSTALISVVTASLIVAGLPTLVYLSRHGSGVDPFSRTYDQVEHYGSRLASLVLPSPDHRIAFLGGPARRLAAGGRPGEGTDPLGLITTAGLLAILAMCALGRRWRNVRDERDGTDAAAATGLLCLLIATVGGLGATFAAITGVFEIRTWSRLSVFLAFCALTVVGRGLQGCVQRISSKFGRPWAWLLLVGLLVFGVLDQSSPRLLPTYRQTAAEWRSDAAFYGGLDRYFAPGTAVFQFPFVGFPEAPPVGGIGSYDPLKGYLHSQHLRWSYGGLNGYASLWQPQALSYSPAEAIRQITLAGFDAAVVDRRGYEDHGLVVEEALRRATGGGPLATDVLGDRTSWDLRKFAAKTRALTGVRYLTARNDVLHPVVALTRETRPTVMSQDPLPPKSGFVGPQEFLAVDGSVIVLHNFGVAGRRIVLVLDVTLSQGSEGSIALLGQGIRISRMARADSPTQIRACLTVAPGDNVIFVATDAPAVIPLEGGTSASMVWSGLRVIDLELSAILTGATTPRPVSEEVGCAS